MARQSQCCLAVSCPSSWDVTWLLDSPQFSGSDLKRNGKDHCWECLFFLFYIFIAGSTNVITKDDRPSLGIKLKWKKQKQTYKQMKKTTQFFILFVVCLSIHLFPYFLHSSQRQNLLSPFWFPPAKLSSCFRIKVIRPINFLFYEASTFWWRFSFTQRLQWCDFTRSWQEKNEFASNKSLP